MSDAEGFLAINRQVDRALRSAGMKPDNLPINFVRDQENQKQALKFLAEDGYFGTLIDLGAAPHIPDEGWRILRQQKGVGHWRFNSGELDLYDIPNSISHVYGKKLRAHFNKHRVALMPANVIDFLLDNPEYFPHEWKRSENGEAIRVYAWGTEYLCGNKTLIRYMYWDGEKVVDHYSWMNHFDTKQKCFVAFFKKK